MTYMRQSGLGVRRWVRRIRQRHLPLATITRSILILTVVIFIAGRIVDGRAHQELQEHRQSIATEGGGVLLVSQPFDCIEFSDVSSIIAERLKDHLVPVRGLIIGDRVPTEVLEEATRIGNFSLRAFRYRYENGYTRASRCGLRHHSSGTCCGFRRSHYGHEADHA